MVHASNMQRELSEKKKQVTRMTKELTMRNNELKAFLSIKRSARLLLGNIKRRILHE